MPLIRRGSNFCFFAALYCSCLWFNALLALPTKEGHNNAIKCKKGAIKCLQKTKIYLAEWYSIFAWIVTSSQILRPWTIIFLLRLLFDLGYRGLLFASMTNLKAWPHLAEVWCAVFYFSCPWPDTMIKKCWEKRKLTLANLWNWCGGHWNCISSEHAFRFSHCNLLCLLGPFL